MYGQPDADLSVGSTRCWTADPGTWTGAMLWDFCLLMVRKPGSIRFWVSKHGRIFDCDLPIKPCSIAVNLAEPEDIFIGRWTIKQQIKAFHAMVKASIVF